MFITHRNFTTAAIKCTPMYKKTSVCQQRLYWTSGLGMHCCQRIHYISGLQVYTDNSADADGSCVEQYAYCTTILRHHALNIGNEWRHSCPQYNFRRWQNPSLLVILHFTNVPE